MSDTPHLRRLTRPRPQAAARPVRDAGRPLFVPLGVLLAAAFFAASLTPSLIPRDAVTQGVLGGAVAAIGYVLGAAAAAIWRFLGIPVLRAAGWRATAAVASLALAGWAALRAEAWQNLSREVAGLPLVDAPHVVTLAGIALAVFAGLMILAALFLAVFRLLARQIRRVLPERVALAVGFAAALWLFWALGDGVLYQRLMEAADASFEAADLQMEPDVAPPDDPARTGSTDSLVHWEEMGRWGRSFVARAPSRDEIAAFAGPEALQPIRVYVGRAAADTPESRAQIALEELIRQGGFDRSALLVMVPVGTGWMDPGGQDTLEFILGGDVATVAVQYSHLTSVLSLITNPEYGIEQSRALFDAIYDHWRGLPEDARPAFYVHGLSQGALNSQATLPLLDLIADPIDGGMWAGSPFLSAFWSHVRRNRDPDTPVWRPRFGDGSLVRISTQAGVDPGAGAGWGPMRFVLLNYGSDPIVHFSFGSALRRPEWLGADRPPDVSPDHRWFPLVTMFQTALDMAVSLQAPRHGHYYVAPDYIDAWVALTDPEGWTEADSARLKALFETRPAPW